MQFFLAQNLFMSGMIVFQWNRNVTFKDTKIKATSRENVWIMRKVGTDWERKY